MDAKNQLQEEKNNSAKNAGIKNAAINAAAAVGVGVASYAYGKNVSEPDIPKNEAGQDVAMENTPTDSEEQLVEATDLELSQDATLTPEGIEVIVEPEPIASTVGIDKIDYEIGTVQGVAGNEDFLPEPDPDLPEENIVVVDDFNDTGITANESIAEADVSSDFIGNDIQTDLLA